MCFTLQTNIFVCKSKFSKYIPTPMYLYVLLICFVLVHLDMCVRGGIGV